MKLLKEQPMEIPNEQMGTIFKIKRFSVHDGPGIRTAVFLKGCPLNCIWCHSPEGISSEIKIWHNNNVCISCGQCVSVCPNKALESIPGNGIHIEIDRSLCKTTGHCVKICPANAIQFTGYSTTAVKVMKEIEKDLAYYKASGGGITLTGGEPLFQIDFSKEILKKCKDKNINTAIETSLYCDSDRLSSIADFVDLFIIDMKIFDQEKHEYYTGKPNMIIKENFVHLAKMGKEIIVRIPIISNITDIEDNKKNIINYIHGINRDIPIEYIPFNPLAENNYKLLGIPFLL
jgi:pyruvate formate lyase activating enzyme